MKNSIRIYVLFVFILMLATLACNGTSTVPSNENGGEQPSTGSDTTPGDSSPAVSTGIDACALFTKADAEAILGQAVIDADPPVQGSATFNVTSCKFKLADPSVFESASLIVTVPVNGDLEAAKTAFNIDRTTSLEMLGAEAVDVPGLGDEAFWVGGYGNSLAILKGNVHLIISVTTQKGETAPQLVIDLANTILSRLP